MILQGVRHFLLAFLKYMEEKEHFPTRRLKFSK